MNPKTHWEQIEQIIKADHFIFDAAIENFKRLLKNDYPPDAAQQLDHITRNVAEKLAHHFAIEEDQLFPALLANNPSPTTVSVIAELRLEHLTLLEESRLLRVLLRGHLPTNLSNEVWLATTRFLDHLKKHDAKEEALFNLFPE